MRRTNVIIIQSEKGGCGKTTIADTISAGLLAAGHAVLNVDADDGNRGLSRRTGKSSTCSLEWQTPAQELDQWLAQNLGDNEFVLIDCGANLLASNAPLTRFLDGLLCRVLEHGGAVYPLAVASTNCPGTARLTRNMRTAFEDYGDVRLILNNQDGSNAFELSPIALGIKSASFPHIPSGIMAARLLSPRPLLDALKAPPEGYRVAMSWLAHAIAKFLHEPIITEIVGNAASGLVGAAASEATGRFWYTVNTLQMASDEALRANAHVHVTGSQLRQIARNYDGNAESLAEATLAWLEAEDMYHRILR